MDAINILETAAVEFTARGPNRVVVSGDGGACNPRRALNAHNVRPDVVFLRNDGWMLGAPARFESVAYRMWADQWIGFMYTAAPGVVFLPITDYRKETHERAKGEGRPLPDAGDR